MTDPAITPIAATIEAVWAGWPEGFRLESHVFGETSAAAIAAMVEGFVAEHLGASAVGAAGYHVSVACVLDLVLDDGRRLVVRAHQPRWTGPFLAATQHVQAHLAAGGFPVATPLMGPTSLGPGLATVETHLPDPGTGSDFGPAQRRVSAAGLAELTGRARSLAAPDGLAADPMAPSPGERYPVPHSPLFVLVPAAPGAAWVDALADRARAQRAGAGAGPVVTHGDWSARNIRLGSERVRAVYDGESLGLLPECWAAGQAGATWSLFGDIDAAGGVPRAADVAAFVAEYERARGRRFSGPERAAAGAAALYTLAYTARCEHALVARGWRPADRPGDAWARLAEEGDALLGLERYLD